MNILPAASSSPWTASLIGSRQEELRRSARNRVNRGGIGCTNKIGRGNSAGSCGKIAPRADGPPVETPIATTFGLTFVLCGAGLLPGGENAALTCASPAVAAVLR